MTTDPRPPRRPARRRYPPQSYIPFALMVAVPLLLLVGIVTLIAHAVAPSSPRLAAAGTPPAHRSSLVRATPTASVTVSAAGAPAPGTPDPQPTHPTTRVPRTRVAAIATSAPTAHATPSPTTTVTATLPVTIALDSSAAGLPVGPATTFHGAHVKLWAFASIPNVRAGDTIHFIWRDLGRHTTVADWPQPVQADAARYEARMYAFPGSNPSLTTPFPNGQYRVDVYHNGVLAASTQFRIVAS